MTEGDTTWPITWLDDVGSTNTWMADAARRGAPDMAAVVARHQSAGRGRFDRTWEAPPDSALLLSVLVRPGDDLPPRHWHLLNLAMGLAVTDVAGPATQLKWPNDVIVSARGDRKLAGILAEAMHPERVVVVGVGCNRARPPELSPVLSERAIWLDEINVLIDARRLAQRVLTSFAEWRGMLEAGGAATTELLDEYRRRCTTIGRDIEVEMAGHTLNGRAVAIDGDGHLHVVDASGESHVVNTGDVVHARARPLE